MKKRLRFLFRFMKLKWQHHQWALPQIVMVIIVSSVFLTTLAWSAPYSVSGADLTPTPIATIQPGQSNLLTPTSLPPEYLNNADQTIGITFAAAMLVLIVVVGLVMFMPRNHSD